MFDYDSKNENLNLYRDRKDDERNLKNTKHVDLIEGSGCMNSK